MRTRARSACSASPPRLAPQAHDRCNTLIARVIRLRIRATESHYPATLSGTEIMAGGVTCTIPCGCSREHDPESSDGPQAARRHPGDAQLVAHPRTPGHVPL